MGCAILCRLLFFFGSPLRGACVPPIEGSSPWGGQLRMQLSPTSKSSPSELVVPMVVPGA